MQTASNQIAHMKPRISQPRPGGPRRGARPVVSVTGPTRPARQGRKLWIAIGILAALGVGAYFAKPYLQEELLPEIAGDIFKKGEDGPAMPGSYIGKTVKGDEWQNPAALQARLGEEILKRLGKIDRNSVKKFLGSKENRLLLAQWQLADFELKAADDVAARQKRFTDELAKLEKKNEELRSELSNANGARRKAINKEIADNKTKINDQRKQAEEVLTLSAFAATPEGAKLLGDITNNLDWIEQIVHSGECVQPGRVVSLMAQMMEKDPKIAYNQIERDTVTATALEFARHGWPTETALDRADYFISSWRANRLNVVFDDLPFWLRRVVTGCKGDNRFCTRESLEWSLDNVHLPVERYSGCCWRNGYKLYNLFGESIHGDGYWEPFEGLFDNSMLFTNKVGGVCGSLSHFGAYSACANGVPALTAGEPGHCAFVLRVQDKWVPSYSLTWERSLHWTPWRETWEYSSLHMADKLYSEDKKEAARSRISNAYRTLASLFATQVGAGDKSKAITCYNQAVTYQPANYLAWRDYADYIARPEVGEEGNWRTLNAQICKLLVPKFPEMASQLLGKYIYPNLNKTFGDDSVRLTTLGEFWKAVDEQGPDRWRVEQFLDKQLELFKQNNAVSDDQKCSFYRAVLSSVASNPTYGTIALSWGTKLAEGMSKAGQDKLMAATIDCLSQGSGIAADDRDKMLGEVLLRAEAMRDRQTYRSIVKMLSPRYSKPDNKLPKFEPFPGKLWSEEGMVYFSSRAPQYDNPCAHPGLLMKGGGHFHTKKEKDSWAAVELPRLINVTGVVVVTTPEHRNRLSGLRIQVSATGRDDDWKDVGQPAGQVPDRVTRFDLQSELPRARYVRVLRPGENFMHLNGIYIYGNQAS